MEATRVYSHLILSSLDRITRRDLAYGGDICVDGMVALCIRSTIYSRKNDEALGFRQRASSPERRNLNRTFSHGSLYLLILLDGCGTELRGILAQQISARSASKEIPSNLKKAVEIGQSKVVILWMEVNSRGVIMTQKESLRNLIRYNKDFTARRTWKASLLKRLLGKWARDMLSRKCLYSIFVEVCLD